MPTNKEYNGYKNRATWNVALYIDNEESLYRAACTFMQKHPGNKAPYANFIRSEYMQEERTPDGFKWLSTRLCYRELNDMMRELIA